jgi:Malate/L-lactate dehydrogenases
MIIKAEEMTDVFARILIKKGFCEEDAKLSAELFTANSLDGVYSHGVNRFPRVLSYIEKGYIKPSAQAVCTERFGGFERWNGNLAMGNVTAKRAMDRAIELAKENGIGLVAINNTNHWMRGGAYGWQAADAGFIGICWTNTQPNMPAWGAKDRRIGNNPFVMAIPRSDGRHVVVDAAMSQYSYGKIEEMKMKGRSLPYPGGFDEEGRLSTDPAAIEKTWRVLPVGFWKGSGLSIAFDLVAAMLSGGNACVDVGGLGGDEFALSQVLIAIDPHRFSSVEETDALVDRVTKDVEGSDPDKEGAAVSYPGERTLLRRKENSEKGIPVDDKVWATILSALD